MYLEFPVMIGAVDQKKYTDGLKPLQMKRFANSVASVQQMVDKLYELNFFDDDPIS